MTITAPSEWSQVAVDILALKYMRKTGVLQPDGTTGGETDARQVFRRLAECWTYWGRQEGYFDTDEDATAFCDEMQYMLAHQIGAPNSPQWFNTGLHLAYGIEGPSQGLWRWDPRTKTTQQVPHAYPFPSASACFIQSIEDNLINERGIMDSGLAKLVFSNTAPAPERTFQLRGRGEKLSEGVLPPVLCPG